MRAAVGSTIYHYLEYILHSSKMGHTKHLGWYIYNSKYVSNSDIFQRRDKACPWTKEFLPEQFFFVIDTMDNFVSIMEGLYSKKFVFSTFL